MQVTVYSLTWDCCNANERVWTRVYATAAERDAELLEWVRSYGIDVESVDDLDKDEIIAEMESREIEFMWGNHKLEVTPEEDS